MPQPGELVRRQAGNRLALEQHLPWLGLTRPMMVLSVVLLPTPLRPSRPDHLARADHERHAVQDVALAVVGVQVLDLDEGLLGMCGGHVLR